ncbi:DNA cytosine methyltransferase [Endozoicomonas acroporae]|uniref:DNA cytosine methyltransferase n=1 Tax=Endozoicomonas acroporae TaxID=1701104 RepID=UPI000C78B300|nr:DNA (cytosine-5-)-methyltransferase [Endozoicomonas acroporae]
MKFAEFFAGVGLVREGLSRDDWSCVWANDISEDKKSTYVENYGDDHFVLGDIWDISQDLSSIPDDVFLYTASFPCTDLSVAGNRSGLAGKQSGTLNAVLHILDKKREAKQEPKVVLLENVKGFLTSHKGTDAANTVKSFSELGYYVDIIELDAVMFTPQSRPRVFFVAVHHSIAKEVMILKQKGTILDTWWATFDANPSLRSKAVKNIISQNEDLNWGLIDIKAPKATGSVLADIIESNLPDEQHLWWSKDRKEHTYSQMSPAHQLKLQQMCNNDHFSYGTVYRRMRKGLSMAELRTDGVAGCLRTPRGGSSKQILIRAGYGDWSVRLLTPREYARLQGVRDDFWLPENHNKGYFAMGDAVCVPVIEYISENIITPIFHHWEKSTA